jgi:hypothetical protein
MLFLLVASPTCAQARRVGRVDKIELGPFIVKGDAGETSKVTRIEFCAIPPTSFADCYPARLYLKDLRHPDEAEQKIMLTRWDEEDSIVFADRRGFFKLHGKYCASLRLEIFVSSDACSRASDFQAKVQLHVEPGVPSFRDGEEPPVFEPLPTPLRERLLPRVTVPNPVAPPEEKEVAPAPQPVEQRPAEAVSEDTATAMAVPSDTDTELSRSATAGGSLTGWGVVVALLVGVIGWLCYLLRVTKRSYKQPQARPLARPQVRRPTQGQPVPPPSPSRSPQPIVVGGGKFPAYRSGSGTGCWCIKIDGQEFEVTKHSSAIGRTVVQRIEQGYHRVYAIDSQGNVTKQT